MNPLKKAFRAVTDALPFFSDTEQGRIKRAFSNSSTGAGTATDVLESMTITFHRRFSRRYLEALYANFWAAAKIVDLKPDDVFGPGIVWGDDDDATESMKEEMKRLKVMQCVPKAVKAARKFGTAILILAPRHGNFLAPFDPERMSKGDISHILIADRYNLEELVLYADPANPKFGQALKYRWNFVQVQGQPSEGQERMVASSIDIHASRCIRFDGIPPLTDDGWENAGEERWGISVLQRAVDDILQDAAASASLIDILKRACIPIIKKEGWTEVLARGGTTFEGELSPTAAVQDISSNISNSKIMVIDKEDEVDKLEVQTSGVNDISKTQTERLAMIEGVPITRFTGQSASGLSATGEGDAKDWRITVNSYRKEAIEPQWEMLMQIVAKNAGLAEPPPWEWGQLGETSLEEQAATTKTMSETVEKLHKNGIWDEAEAREFMNNSEIVDFDPDDVPDEIPPIEQAKQDQIAAQQSEQLRMKMAAQPKSPPPNGKSNAGQK